MLNPPAKMPAKIVGGAPVPMVTSGKGWFGYAQAGTPGLTINGEHAYLTYLNALYGKPQAQWPTFLAWGGDPKDPVWLMLQIHPDYLTNPFGASLYT